MSQIKIVLLFSALLISYLSCSQTTNLDDNFIDEYFNELKNLNFVGAREVLDLNGVFDNTIWSYFHSLIEDHGQNLSSLENEFSKVDSTSIEELAIIHLVRAYKAHWNENDRVRAFPSFLKAYETSIRSSHNSLIKFSLSSILSAYRSGSFQQDTNFEHYINLLEPLCNDPSDYFILNSFKFNLIAQTEIYNPIKFENDSLFKIINKSQDSLIKILPSNSLLSTLYLIDRANYQVKKNPEDAISLYKKGLEQLPDELYFNPIKYQYLTNLSRAYAGAQFPQRALDVLEQSIPYRNKNNPTKNIIAYHGFSAEYYASMKVYDSAFSHSKKARYLGYELKFQEHNTQISKVKEELDNEKLRANNLESESKRTRNRNIAYGLGGGVVAVSLIGFLLFTNSRRKQRIAEQQSEIEIQKTEKILKEQELTTIDAMIEGQEKERQRLASDLHDSVGATLAAAKLQFDHLAKNREKLSNLDELFGTTGKLLDDAYTEVRSMAHAKNSGVIAKNGLLPAVQKLAKNASGTNQLKIEVEDFGLNERLENSLEIAVFRMIQELVTNVIKHAQAKEATISITQHEDSLNIIVEDNGIGFNPKQSKPNADGMGLSSIERRVEFLEGSMEVDSSEGKGTTIVIDIPI